MEWQVHGRREVYRSEWVELWLDDVEIPGGDRFEHHVLRFPKACVSSVVVDGDRVLMLWRNRFITDSWGWEVPAGWVDLGEDPLHAVRREVEEETGWRPRAVEPMTTFFAVNGIGDMRFTLYLAHGADHIGDPQDVTEAARVDWLPLTDVPELIRRREITDGPTLMALGYYLGIHRPTHPAPPTPTPS